MKLASGYYPRLRTWTEGRVIGPFQCVAAAEDRDGHRRTVARGESWLHAYANLRANLPKRMDGTTDWPQVDALVTP